MKPMVEDIPEPPVSTTLVETETNDDAKDKVNLWH